jgi:hypothetical protein
VSRAAIPPSRAIYGKVAKWSARCRAFSASSSRAARLALPASAGRCPSSRGSWWSARTAITCIAKRGDREPDPPLNQYDAAATDLRELFTDKPDFRPYNFKSIQYASKVSPEWLALTRDIDFSHPDADEVKLRAAILKSEGLPRPPALPKK